MKLKNGFRLAVLSSAILTLGISSAHAASISWTNSLSGAMATAKKTGKPILVNFSASWCTPCKVMEKTTFKDAAVVAESKKWIMVYIDTDKQEKLAEKYKVSGYPTFLVMKPNGKEISRMSGVKAIQSADKKSISSSKFLNWIKPKYSAAKS